jgi:hypothetical protein
MTFEEWYESYDPNKFLTSHYDDLREAFKAGSDSKYFSIINKIQGDYFPSPKENTDD